MTMEMTSRVIGNEGVDFLEIDGKEVARVLEGTSRSEIEDHLNPECDCELNDNEYNEHDLDEARDEKRGEVIDSVRSFLEDCDAIDKKAYAITNTHLESIR